MKAIKITQQLKDTNPELFGGIVVDFIRTFSSIPNFLKSLNYNQNQRTDGYNLLDNSIHQLDGFFDVEETEVGENQIRGELYFDEENKVFKYEVLEKPEPTIEEIQEKEFFLYQKRKSDGETAYLKLSAEFRLAKNAGVISEETHSYLEELLSPMRNEIMFGQWKKGLEMLENLGSDKIGVDLYNRLHLMVRTYINENY